MNIQSLPEHFHEWNEVMVKRHDPEIFHHHPQRIVRWIEGLRVSKVLKLLDVNATDTVLDIGCGAGNMLENITAKQLHGVDLSKQMTERAQKRLGQRATITCGDAEQLPYPDNTFDRVICSSVLSHLYRPELVLNEAYRVLKPSGKLVVSVSYEAGIERGLRLAKKLWIDRMFLGGGSKEAHEHVYSSEYHLHHFDVKLLSQFASQLPKAKQLVKTPFFFPVHIIAEYQK